MSQPTDPRTLKAQADALASMCDARAIASNDVLFQALAAWVREVAKEVQP